MSRLDEIEFKQKAQERVLDKLLQNKSNSNMSDNPPIPGLETKGNPNDPAPSPPDGQAPQVNNNDGSSEQSKPVRFKIGKDIYEFLVPKIKVAGRVIRVEDIEEESDLAQLVESNSSTIKKIN